MHKHKKLTENSVNFFMLPNKNYSKTLLQTELC